MLYSQLDNTFLPRMQIQGLLSLFPGLALEQKEYKDKNRFPRGVEAKYTSQEKRKTEPSEKQVYRSW